MSSRQRVRYRAAVLTALIVIIVSACSESKVPEKAAPKAAVKCGQVSELVSYPGNQAWRGAVAGPFFFSAFAPGQTTAVLSDYVPEYPYKVLVQPTRQLPKPVNLMGWDCSTGERLRFWYRAGLPFAHLPASPAEFASAGDLVATFSLGSSDSTGQPSGYTGYMLFTHAGHWKVSVEEPGTVTASVVLLVQPSK